MMNFENAQICATAEAKRETAKELLENTTGILAEMYIEVRMIADAVYRGDSPNKVEEEHNEPKATPPMLAMMREHMCSADYLLKEIKKIREALW